jgi:outer membrane protein assembly factor BamB
MFRNNLAHTGETTSQGPIAEVVKLWNFTTWGVVWSSPTVVGNRLYIGSDDGNLFCLNSETGEKIWNYPTGQTVGTTPTVVGNYVYMGSYDNNVY